MRAISPIIFDEQWTQITEAVVPYIQPYYYISTYGRVYSAITDRFLTLVVDRDGYTNVTLHLRNDSPYYRNQVVKRVNRLVLASFAPVEGWEKLIANHKDSIRGNNFLYNLEWVSEKENTEHGILYGNFYKPDISGINNPMCKLNEDQVREIINLIKSKKYTFKEIASKFNVSDSVISNIANNRSWTHLNTNPDYLPHYTLFSDEEVHIICNFFESNDINNLDLYPSIISLFNDCLNKTGLYNKFEVEKCRKTLSKILRKRTPYNIIANNYNYQFIR